MKNIGAKLSKMSIDDIQTLAALEDAELTSLAETESVISLEKKMKKTVKPGREMSKPDKFGKPSSKTRGVIEE